MSIRDDLRKLRKDVQRIRANVKSIVRDNVRVAASEMQLKAKEETPPHEGQERGLNTVTGNMAAHWKASYVFTGEMDCTVRLSNNVQYASYVENGHRMNKHFVPWLYIDDSGLLSRRIPEPGEPLFGLVVGTKTEYVPPEHIVPKAKERFFEVYYRLQLDIADYIDKEFER